MAKKPRYIRGFWPASETVCIPDVQGARMQLRRFPKDSDDADTIVLTIETDHELQLFAEAIHRAMKLRIEQRERWNGFFRKHLPAEWKIELPAEAGELP